MQKVIFKAVTPNRFKVIQTENTLSPSVGKVLSEIEVNDLMQFDKNVKVVIKA